MIDGIELERVDDGVGLLNPDADLIIRQGSTDQVPSIPFAMQDKTQQVEIRLDQIPRLLQDLHIFYIGETERRAQVLSDLREAAPFGSDS